MLVYEMIIDLFSVQQVILPLLEQYVKSHCLYFLSTSSSDNRSHASRKEKEMIAWYKTKFAFLFFILLSDHFSAILCIFIYLKKYLNFFRKKLQYILSFYFVSCDFQFIFSHYFPCVFCLHVASFVSLQHL